MSRRAIYAVVAGAAVLIAAVLIGVSVSGGEDDGKATLPPPPPAATTDAVTTGAGSSNAATTGAAPTGDDTFLAGIPQSGIELGDPNAKVVVVELADLQCPYCAQFSNETFPSLVDEYVRSGDVKLEFDGVDLLGEDSETAVRAVYAAGLQNRLWDLVQLLYAVQGEENSGWVTDDLLREVGARVPGLDVERMLDDMDSDEVDALLDQARSTFQAGQFPGTPAFIYARAGESPAPLGIGALDIAAFRAKLDPLLES